MVEVVAKRRGRGGASKFKHLSHLCGMLTVLATCLLPLMVSWLPRFRPSTNEVTNTEDGDIVLVECLIGTPKAPFVNENNEKEAGAEGLIEIQVRQDLSPIASKVFLDLVKAQYYDGCFIFRVLEGFVAQWGHHHFLDVDFDNSNHKIGPWPDTTKPPKEKDEFVKGKTLSNKRGTLSFAGGNPQIQQVFVNLADNTRLDVLHSYPFATLTEKSMTQVMDKLYMGYKDGEGQIKALEKGEKATLEQFPRMSMVEQCRVVTSFSPATR